MPNQQVIAKFFDAMNSGDLEVMGEVLLPEARFDFPKTALFSWLEATPTRS